MKSHVALSPYTEATVAVHGQLASRRPDTIRPPLDEDVRRRSHSDVGTGVFVAPPR